MTTLAPSLVADRDRWNQFVSGAPDGHVLQSWEWGEIKAAGGWRPVRLALTDGDRLHAAAQILLRTLPLGMGQLAYVPKGPVLAWQDAALRREMLAALRKTASELGAISVKLEPEMLDGPLAADLASHGLVPASPVQMRSSIWIDLTQSEDELLARQKQKTRYNIRLAAKKGVTIVNGTSRDLPDWYQMYATTARRDAFVIHSLDYYQLVLDTLQPRGMATLLLARHDDDLLAGIIVFHFGNKAQYMYGASSNLKRNLMAPYLLQWEGMRLAKERGCSIYDLWGIPDRLEEKEDLWGVYRHKRGYGGEVVRYVGAFDLVESPLRHLALERLAQPAFKRVGRLRAHGVRAPATTFLRPLARLRSGQ